ncbi:MAG TPA: beta-ketoacyl synthase N-terminal-like domain-containing protein, partial [Longimicrobiales bacterium]
MRRVAVIAGCRTPFAKAGTTFRDMSAVELGTVAVRDLISRSGIDPEVVDEIVYGIVVPSVLAPNVAREVGIAAGLPLRVPAYSVSRACASSNQAITSAADSIALGNADVIVAGGVEVLSDVPMLLSKRL